MRGSLCSDLHLPKKIEKSDVSQQPEAGLWLNCFLRVAFVSCLPLPLPGGCVRMWVCQELKEPKRKGTSLATRDPASSSQRCLVIHCASLALIFRRIRGKKCYTDCQRANMWQSPGQIVGAGSYISGQKPLLSRFLI